MKGVFFFIKNMLIDHKDKKYLIYFIVFSLMPETDLYHFYNSIYKNLFVNIETKNKLIKIYYKAAFLQYKIKRLVHYYRWKKTDKMDIETDLYGNSLSLFPHNQKITILQNKKKFIFRLTDISTMWRVALTHSQYLRTSPKNLSNPYTALPFKEHNLYNIYFKLSYSSFHIHPLITCFFRVNMDLNDFKIIHFSHLQDCAIVNYFKTINPSDKWHDINEMLKEYSSYSITQELSNLEKKYLIKKYNPYLLHYYYSEYSNNILLRGKHKKILEEFFG